MFSLLGFCPYLTLGPSLGFCPFPSQGLCSVPHLLSGCLPLSYSLLDWMSVSLCLDICPLLSGSLSFLCVSDPLSLSLCAPHPVSVALPLTLSTPVSGHLFLPAASLWISGGPPSTLYVITDSILDPEQAGARASLGTEPIPLPGPSVPCQDTSHHSSSLPPRLTA